MVVAVVMVAVMMVAVDPVTVELYSFSKRRWYAAREGDDADTHTRAGWSHTVDHAKMWSVHVTTAQVMPQPSVHSQIAAPRLVPKRVMSVSAVDPFQRPLGRTDDFRFVDAHGRRPRGVPGCGGGGGGW